MKSLLTWMPEVVEELDFSSFPLNLGGDELNQRW